MFQGSIVALVTPMTEGGAIDYSAFEKLIDWQIKEGTQAILVLGTTGESPTLSREERTQIIQTAVASVNNRVPLIVGTGNNNTQSSIELTREAMHLGADAALLVCPYYNKPTQEGIHQHYKAIASNVAIPQIIYNVPARTGQLDRKRPFGVI